jgi:hypothetical protein
LITPRKRAGFEEDRIELSGEDEGGGESIRAGLQEKREVEELKSSESSSE